MYFLIVVGLLIELYRFSNRLKKRNQRDETWIYEKFDVNKFVTYLLFIILPYTVFLIYASIKQFWHIELTIISISVIIEGLYVATYRNYINEFGIKIVNEVISWEQIIKYEEIRRLGSSEIEGFQFEYETKRHSVVEFIANENEITKIEDLLQKKLK